MVTMAKDSVGHVNYVNISDPMSLWIGLLVIALIIGILLSPTSSVNYGNTGFTGLTFVYRFFIFGPGMLLLPAIAGVWIGISVGKNSSGLKKAFKTGLANALYGAILYIISIFIIYEIMVYVLPGSAVAQNTLITQWIVLPVVIFIVLVELLALIAHSRGIPDEP